MAHTTSPRALRIGSACLLAVLALLVARAQFASAGAAGAPGAAANAGQCGGGGSPAQAMDAAVAEAMEAGPPGRGDSADSGWVVLNNRGYNYGPPPGVQPRPGAPPARDRRLRAALTPSAATVGHLRVAAARAQRRQDARNSSARARAAPARVSSRPSPAPMQRGDSLRPALWGDGGRRPWAATREPE